MSIRGADWKKLQEIFHSALALPADEREAYLNDVCPLDSDLRAAVQSLLDSHSEPSDFLDQAAHQAAANMLADDVDLLSGQTLAHYKLISKLGAGGMGQVYLAQDMKLQRRVCLKFLTNSFADDEQLRRRFEQEALAISALNHPNTLTIHEISEFDGQRFIATEFIDGLTLRERLSSPLNINEALEIAIQIGSALAAAHRVNIVHRDIKPENIMVRNEDALVKVLDFGLAKTERSTSVVVADSTLNSMLSVNTAPGVVMGTASYMSPEQARAESVDQLTDIWSLGVVLYEMIAGCAPFVGTTSSEILAAILSPASAPPLALYAPDRPAEVEQIVQRALSKDKARRYQTAKEFVDDLRKLKQNLDTDDRTPQSTSPEPLPTLGLEDLQTSALSQNVSTYRHVTSDIKRHKSLIGITLAVIIALLGGTLMWRSLRKTQPPLLTDKDTLLVADFDNKTGDEIFNQTLKQALALQLSQSPFLSIFPDPKVRQTLKLMNRSPDDRVFGEVAREVCQRQGLKAFVAGSIAPLGSHYVLTLEAINSASGEVMARTQAQAEHKEQVLRVLSEASTTLREGLGESLKSIEKFDKPPEVTTSSLDALRALALGREQIAKGGYREAIPFMKRAIELDPNCAQAYTSLASLYANIDEPAHAAETAAMAYSLRDKVTEIERFRITHMYESFATHDLEKSIENLEVWRQTYPRDYVAPTNLAAVYAWIGRPDKSAEAAREGMRLDPNNVIPRFNLAFALTRLNRFDEALDVLEEALQKKFDNSDIRFFLYLIFAVRGDSAGMQQQLEWTKGRPDEYHGFHWQAHTASFIGHWRQAQDVWRKAVDLAVKSDAKEEGAGYAAEEAVEAAALGQCQVAKNAASQSLKLTAEYPSQPRTALALALCDEPVQARRILAGPAKVYPKDTKLNRLWLPTIEAAIELRRGNAQKALELLESPSRYEGEAEYWPQTLRAQSYLRLNRAEDAAAEFQKIIDNRGQGPLCELYVLAHLGLARALAMSGNLEKSRLEYEEFFKLWKTADAALFPLKEARSEYARLTQALL